VLLLEGKGKPIDYRAKNLKQLGNTVKSLGFIGKLEEDVVDGSSDKGSEVEKLSVDTMKGGLQEVSLAGVLRIEKLKKLENKAVVNVCLGDVGVEILALNEAQEELINDLDMWPSDLKNGLIFFGIESFTLRVHWRWDRTEQILGKHVDNLGVHGFCDDLSVIGDVIQQLVQSKSLDLL
jgi:hypothetical protein